MSEDTEDEIGKLLHELGSVILAIKDLPREVRSANLFPLMDCSEDLEEVIRETEQP